MKGHIIVDQESKQGWIFVPDAHLRFSLLVLKKEAVIHSMRTYPGSIQVIWPEDHMEYKIRQTYDFVSDLDVPPEILSWAQYMIDRNDRWNARWKEVCRVADEKMRADGIADGITRRFLSRETVDKYYGKVDREEPDHPPELDHDAEARFAIYQRVQGWILEAGGLI